jgi:hypothetical protein
VEGFNATVAGLKLALGTLADVVSEEIEHIKRQTGASQGQLEQRVILVEANLEQACGAVSR